MPSVKEEVDLAKLVSGLMADLKNSNDSRHTELNEVMKRAEESHPHFKSPNPLKAREAYFAGYEALKKHIEENYQDIYEQYFR
ncbi:MAG TPA: hypothetical protein VJI46_06665 [Candidatus Nanoarchaeia archaeon]|nr:hypothetical protein [Candidatus Nanoarchaeia archaeon]